MKKIVLYSHGGSENHGCEAIIRSSVKILNNNYQYILLSNNPSQDIKYKLNEICDIRYSYNKPYKNIIDKFLFLLKMKLLKRDYYFYKSRFKEISKKTKGAVLALSVGGDNYCYKGYDEELKAINKKLSSQKISTILWGCSVEPNFLNSELVNHLSNYQLIVARESITYKALLKSGLEKVVIYPDSAFQLDRVDLPLPNHFVEKNTVGINISPLILKYEKGSGIINSNIENLINYILKETNYHIALIPHVVWNHNDDRIPLEKIFNQYKDTNRVCFIQDANAMEIKGYIARCRFMIAARTHASIAAYSQHVPTLVLGYSVKAKGIATDIFGSYENYVLPVQGISSEFQLLEAFRFIEQNEDKILKHYSEFMPDYKQQALEVNKELEKF